jgi:hypothetical protein
MRFVIESAAAVVTSSALFGAMQLFGRAKCFDCGARVGFPLAYMQEGTYAPHGRASQRTMLLLLGSP